MCEMYLILKNAGIVRLEKKIGQKESRNTQKKQDLKLKLQIEHFLYAWLFRVQADLRDIAGLAPVQRNEANIEIK